MYLEIYIDILFLINFCMNIFLLIIVKRVLKRQSTWYRLIISAALGAVLLCFIAVFPRLNIIIKIGLMYIISTSLMVIIAFKYKNIRKTVKEVLMLFIVTFFIGGILNSIYYYTDVGFYFQELMNGRLYGNINTRFYVSAIISLFLVVKFVIPNFLRNKEKVQNLYEVEITYKHSKLQGTGLYDTGNELSDPFSRKPVILANYCFVEEILDESLREYIKAYYNIETKDFKIKTDNTIEYADKIKFIPFHSVGKKSGILIGIICDEVMINLDDEKKAHENVIVAIYDGKLSTKDDYQIILHKELL